MTLFRGEAIPTDSLNNYVEDLKNGNAEGAFRGFLATFSTALQSNEIDNEQIFKNISSPPDSFPKDVLESLQLTINEASVCYKSECYLATIVLCGRIIETVVKNAYRAILGHDPVKTLKSGQKVDMDFVNIREELHDKGVLIDKGLNIQLELIYHHRSAAVHGNVKIPTEPEAKHIAGLTQDAIDRIYQYFIS